MCGIVYCKDMRQGKKRKGVAFKVAELYTKQRARGKQGFGFYAPENDRFVHHTEEGRILTLLRREKQAKEILFHHRMPTSTNNVYNACHPISTRSETGNVLKHTYIGVHNGVLWNERDLRAKHEAMGISYITRQSDDRFNDSESLIWDLALAFEGKKEFEARGGMAWIVMELVDAKPVKLHFGRNSRPLHIHRKAKKFLTLSSEGPGPDIQSETHYTYDYKTGEYDKQPMAMEGTRAVTDTSPAKDLSDVSYAGGAVYNWNLRNHTYRNGHFDSRGHWVPKVQRLGFRTSSASSTDTSAPFEQAKMVEFFRLVDTSIINEAAQKVVVAAQGNKETAYKALCDQVSIFRHKATAIRHQLEYKGVLFIDHNKFANLDRTLFEAEMDLYILHRAAQKIKYSDEAQIKELTKA